MKYYDYILFSAYGIMAGFLILLVFLQNEKEVYTKIHITDVYISDQYAKDIIVYKNVQYNTLTVKELKRNRILNFSNGKDVQRIITMNINYSYYLYNQRVDSIKLN